MMKFTRMQKGWLLILLAINPLFIGGLMSFIAKETNETFTNLGYFIMGGYTLLWLLILIGYITKKDKLVKEIKPRTIEQLIDDSWKEHKKEKELKK